MQMESAIFNNFTGYLLTYLTYILIYLLTYSFSGTTKCEKKFQALTEVVRPEGPRAGDGVLGDGAASQGDWLHHPQLQPTSYRVWGTAVSYPSRVWSRTPAQTEFGALWR